MNVLLDTDILLDLALDRAAFVEDSGRVIQSCQQTALSAIVAWHTISNLYYVLRSTRGDAHARNFITDVLRFAKVASGGKESVDHALTLTVSDFEDALQVAAGLSAGAEFVVTRNIRDYHGSPLPAITPHDFATRFLSA